MGFLSGFHLVLRFITLTWALCLLGFLVPAAFANGTRSVNWTVMNLTPQQQNNMDRLDSSWKKTYAEVYPQIVRDKSTLRHLLQSPNSDEQQILQLHERIRKNEELLHQEAIRNFLDKKKQLDPTQRQKLQELMGN